MFGLVEWKSRLNGCYLGPTEVSWISTSTIYFRHSISRTRFAFHLHNVLNFFGLYFFDYHQWCPQGTNSIVQLYPPWTHQQVLISLFRNHQEWRWFWPEILSNGWGIFKEFLSHLHLSNPYPFMTPLLLPWVRMILLLCSYWWVWWRVSIAPSQSYTQTIVQDFHLWVNWNSSYWFQFLWIWWWYPCRCHAMQVRGKYGNQILLRRESSKKAQVTKMSAT